MNIFEPSSSYRVKKTFASGASSFTINEIVFFEVCSYSPYDNSYAYEFIDIFNVKKTWWVHEDRSIEDWQQFFKLVQLIPANPHAH